MSAMELFLDQPMPLQEREVELVRQIAAGDDNALRALYAAYGQRLYAYALRLTNDPALAEDVLQDSLVAAWQGASRFRGEGRLIAWLLGIVHHTALNTLKAQNLQRNQSLGLMEESLSEPASREPTPDDLAAMSEQHRQIRAGLERLSIAHRMVLELVFYQGLSLDETAKICNCPVGTVKSRLNYAKASLRGILSREGFHAEDIE